MGPQHGSLRSYIEASQLEVALPFPKVAAISLTTVRGWRSASNALPLALVQFASNAVVVRRNIALTEFLRSSTSRRKRVEAVWIACEYPRIFV
jgi:hypothetical protein